jgi:hypothetical protein
VLGDKLRYVEYFYKKTMRIHQISSVDFSEYLEQIITVAQKGATLNELATLVIAMLPEENIPLVEAESFILELISNQILVNDLEPEITGRVFLFQLLKVINETQNPIQFLHTLLQNMDTQPLGKSIELYKEAEEIVKTTGTAYEKNLHGKKTIIYFLG